MTRASPRAVSAGAIALAVLLALVLTPAAAHAWTPGTHIFLGEAIMRSLALLPSSVAELLAAYPYDFLYGSIAADTSIAKKYAAAGRHCHSWNVGLEIHDNAESEPLRACDIYTEQCSIGVTAKDLATMAATLAFGGQNPVTKKQVFKTDIVPEVLAVMATAGLYDDTGKWLYHTGLPAKSGVGGGIIAVSPGKFGIAVVSPPLDDAGNSVKAQKVITDISNALGGNPYAASKPMTTAKKK